MLSASVGRLGLAALGEGQRDLGDRQHLDGRGRLQLHRRVEVGLARHRPGAEPGADHLAPEQARFDEVVHRLPVDAGAPSSTFSTSSTLRPRLVANSSSPASIAPSGSSI